MILKIIKYDNKSMNSKLTIIKIYLINTCGENKIL